MRVAIALDEAAAFDEFDGERIVHGRGGRDLVQPGFDMGILAGVAQRAAPPGLRRPPIR